MDTKFDLSKPAFGEGAQVLEEVPAEKPEEKAPEVKVEDKKEEGKEPETSAEENKVPYSRFEKFHKLAKEKEVEAEEFKQKAEFFEREVERIKGERSLKQDETGETPNWWKELYGDSDQSQKAWKTYHTHEQELEQRAEARAFERMKSEQTQATEREKRNLETLDSHLERVAAVAGRDLTESETDKVLDIIDDFTPKNDDGSYSGSLISPDKAWQIYELQNKGVVAPKKQARDNVAALAGASTEQSSTDREEEDKNFNPQDWGAWRKKAGSL